MLAYTGKMYLTLLLMQGYKGSLGINHSLYLLLQTFSA
jgi:hypothetical protein